MFNSLVKNTFGPTKWADLLFACQRTKRCYFKVIALFVECTHQYLRLWSWTSEYLTCPCVGYSKQRKQEL